MDDELSLNLDRMLLRRLVRDCSPFDRLRLLKLLRTKLLMGTQISLSDAFGNTLMTASEDQFTASCIDT